MKNSAPASRLARPREGHAVWFSGREYRILVQAAQPAPCNAGFCAIGRDGQMPHFGPVSVSVACSVWAAMV